VRENIIDRITPGTISARVPKKTMTPTTMVSAHIDSSLDRTNLTDAPESTCPFTIRSDATLIVPPSAMGANTSATRKIEAKN
jgi:hypothetical protein